MPVAVLAKVWLQLATLTDLSFPAHQPESGMGSYGHVSLHDFMYSSTYNSVGSALNERVGSFHLYRA